jgi:hypothetical protein
MKIKNNNTKCMKFYFNNIRKHEHQMKQTKLGWKIVPQTYVEHIKGSYFYLYLFANLIQGNFHKGFHMPIKKKFKIFLN